MKRPADIWHAVRKWSGWQVVRWGAIVLVTISGLIYVVVVYAYPINWTGFNSKTLWDWLSLLGVPVMLALATAGIGLFQERNRRLSELTERDLAAERAREDALQAYLDDMGELMLVHKLGKSPTKRNHLMEVRALARAKTLTILRVLAGDANRRTAVGRFLSEAGLMKGSAELDFSGADLSMAILTSINAEGAQLKEANLGGVNLQGAYLQDANLQEIDLQNAVLADANLKGAHLSGANLKKADLLEANLQEADLRFAELQQADLSGVDLTDAFMQAAMLHGAYLGWTKLQRTNLYKAELQKANLVEANMEGANLAKAVFDRKTILPDGSKWTQSTDMTRFTDSNHLDFWRSNIEYAPAWRGKKDG